MRQANVNYLLKTRKKFYNDETLKYAALHSSWLQKCRLTFSLPLPFCLSKMFSYFNCEGKLGILRVHSLYFITFRKLHSESHKGKNKFISNNFLMRMNKRWNENHNFYSKEIGQDAKIFSTKEIYNFVKEEKRSLFRGYITLEIYYERIRDHFLEWMISS